MNSDWLDIEILEDYLDGKLDARAMHKIEKQALEDPFVAQALAGLSESPKRARGSVSLLQKQLYERIYQQQVQKRVTVFTWQRLSVAAAAAVMFTSVSILFFMREKENRDQLAKGRGKRVEVNMAPSAPGVDSAREEVYAAVTPAISVPVGGWAKFDNYLNDNNKLITAGTSGKFVELSFLIDSDGNPSDLRIEKSVLKELDDEAIRLIKDGPKWEVPKQPNSRVTYTVAF